MLVRAAQELNLSLEQLQGAWVRVDRQTSDLLRAQEQGESQVMKKHLHNEKKVVINQQVIDWLDKVNFKLNNIIHL